MDSLVFLNEGDVKKHDTHIENDVHQNLIKDYENRDFQSYKMI